MASSGSTPDNPNDSGAANSDAQPESSTGASKSSVRKDRACPFCHQSFTSSSLGRHLDFFIREKNPKAPDGLHDVQQIRKMRENITRRHTRVPSGTVVDNSSRRWSVTSIASPKASHKSQNIFPPPLQKPPPSPTEHTLTQPVHGTSGWLSKNWTATGVINDLPPRVSSNPLPRILPRPDVKKSLLPHPYSNVAENDDARAAELALKEVLRTIKSAASRAQKPPLFDFDFYTFNFPSLCLRLLPMPATLFSTTPMAGPTSWPLGLPAESHFVAIREQLADRFHTLQDSLEAEVSSVPKDQTVTEPKLASSIYSPEFKGYFDHLEAVYQYWQGLSEQQRMEVWHIEMLRAYAQESEKNNDLQRRLDELQREANRFKAQVEDARAQHQSWQYMPHAETSNAASPRLPTGIHQSLVDTGVDLHDWDYDKLIAKYKPIVQKTRRQSAVANLATNDIRTAHERALPAFGTDSLLLRPMMAPQGSPDALLEGELAKNRRATSEAEDDSQEEEGDWDEDVDMEDEPNDIESGAARRFSRQGAG